MTGPLMAAVSKETLHTDASPLGACLWLGIETAPSLAALAKFWAGHQRALRMLTQNELVALTNVKDQRKVTLS